MAATLPLPNRGIRRRHLGLRRALAAAVAAALVVAAVGTISVIGAWRTPGNESFTAKWTDWLRSHHGGWFATQAEDYYFTHKQPAKGGEVTALNPVAGVSPSTTGSSSPPATVALHLPPPDPVPLVVTPAAPGEGMWLPAGPSIDGGVGLYVSQFRADTAYTSQLATAVWVDPTRLSIGLHPGSTEPGGTWSVPPVLAGSERARAVAAFNGGFRLKDAHGGFYLDGSTAVPLVAGAASMVIYDSGRVDVGAWGRDDTAGPHVVAVLQNLTLMVDGGVVDPSISHNDTRSWGQTLRGSIAVARSGIGVTGNGALVYVAGPALTAAGLADSLRRAGAVRAMTLDINPEWVSFNLFNHPDPANPDSVAGAKLYPQMQRPADRYLSADSRDFFSIELR